MSPSLSADMNCNTSNFTLTSFCVIHLTIICRKWTDQRNEEVITSKGRVSGHLQSPPRTTYNANSTPSYTALKEILLQILMSNTSLTDLTIALIHNLSRRKNVYMRRKRRPKFLCYLKGGSKTTLFRLPTSLLEFQMCARGLEERAIWRNEWLSFAFVFVLHVKI